MILLTQRFQFHYGSVKSTYWKAPIDAKKNFNSTMVRLKVHHRSFSLCNRLNFNSTMVRLKDVTYAAAPSGEEISIPLWFG